MEQVKRFEMYTYGCYTASEVGMELAEHGEYVLYEDYASMRQKLEAALDLAGFRGAMIDDLLKNNKIEPVSIPSKLPDGWVALPRKLTAENGAKSALIGEFKEECPSICPECIGSDDIDDCETCDGSGRIYLEVPVSWTTIKNIWDKAVEHFTPPNDSTT